MGRRLGSVLDVVALDVLVNDCVEMSTSEDELPVQTFAADGADEALGESICTRCPDRRRDHPEGIIEPHPSL